MRKILVVFLITLFSSNLYAAGSDRITVLEFTTSGVSEAEMLLFIDYISSEISKNNRYILIDRRQRENILEELSFSNSGCTDEQCQLEIGKLLSANLIIVGSIGSIGSTYILNMQLVDIETGETAGTISKKYKSLDELVNDSQKLIPLLLNNGISEPAARPAAAVSTKPASSVQTSSSRRITSRDGLFGTPIYIFQGKSYYSELSPDLMKIMIPYIPETAENTILYNGYINGRETGFGFVWGGLGTFGLGVIGGAIAGGMLDSTVGFDTVMNIGTIGGLGVCVILEIIGICMLSGSYENFGELVKIYNSNLYR
jgi:hypothetical protein